MRRLVSTPMPIIEEIDEDEAYIDLVGMLEELASDWSVRMVKSEVLVVSIAGEEEDEGEDYEEDELHKWYKDAQVDKINAEKAKPGEEIVRWSEIKQDWMVKPFEIPSPGCTE